MFYGFDTMFSVLFPLVFIIILGIFIYTIVGNVATWNKNNQSPRLSVSAKIVSKRMNISHHNHANAGDVSGAHGFNTTTFTSYYVTFQVEGGDRMELAVSGTEYGIMAEGDDGILSFQGSRFLGFEREMPVS